MVGIAYGRVSTEDQARHGYSLPDQLSACRGKAVSLGATQVIDCVDEGVSGEVLNRPGLEKARQLIRAGGVSFFVCLDPDRLARKLSLQLLLTEELDRARVKLDFVNFDWRDTPEGRLFYSLRGAIAEFEKEKIRERTMRGKRQKAKQGLLTHSPGVYGYSYHAGQLTVDERQSAIVRLIFDLCIHDGLGSQAIAARLNQMGLSSPRGIAWQKMTVKRILQNPTYTGTLYLNRYNSEGRKSNPYLPVDQRRPVTKRPREEWIAVSVPSIVNEDTHAAARKVLANARRLRPGFAKATYLLGGIIRCGACGRTMHGNLTTSRGKKHRYYVCTGRAPGDPPGTTACVNGFRRADELEDAVWREAVSWLEDLSLWLELLENLQSAPPDMGPQLEMVESELGEIKQERNRLLTVLQRGLVPLADLEDRLAVLQSREQKLRVALASLAPQQEPLAEVNLGKLEGWAREHLEGLEHRGDEEKKRFIRKVIRQVTVGPGENLRLEPKLPDLV